MEIEPGLGIKIDFAGERSNSIESALRARDGGPYLRRLREMSLAFVFQIGYYRTGAAARKIFIDGVRRMDDYTGATATPVAYLHAQLVLGYHHATVQA